jgi:predicted nucleic acid-binding protein
MNSPSVRLIHVDEALFDEAWQYFTRHEDKSYSFTDCLSFAVMKQFEIQTALTFDRHFVQAGFQKIPEIG